MRPTWETLATSLVLDAPERIRESIADAVSNVSMYYRCHGWPIRHRVVCAKMTKLVVFTCDERGYAADLFDIKQQDTPVWSWSIRAAEAYEGWPYLSAAPVPLMLRHDEVAA
jgi:hypothetical protein